MTASPNQFVARTMRRETEDGLNATVLEDNSGISIAGGLT